MMFSPSDNSGIKILSTPLLMAVILTVVYSKGLRGFSGIVIGGILGLDVFFLGSISGASMNPARSWSMLCFQAFRLTCGFTGHHFYRNFFHCVYL